MQYLDSYITSFEAEEEFSCSLYSLERRSLKNVKNVHGAQAHCQQLQKLKMNRYSNCNKSNKCSRYNFSLEIQLIVYHKYRLLIRNMEVNLETCQTPMMELFSRIVNS